MSELKGLTEYKSEDLEIAISNYVLFNEFYIKYYLESIIKTAEYLYTPTFWGRIFRGKTLKDVHNHKCNPYSPSYAEWVIDNEGTHLHMSPVEQNLINLYYYRWSASTVDNMQQVCGLHYKGNKTLLNKDLSQAVKFFLDEKGLKHIKDIIMEGYECRKQLLQQ